MCFKNIKRCIKNENNILLTHYDFLNYIMYLFLKKIGRLHPINNQD